MFYLLCIDNIFIFALFVNQLQFKISAIVLGYVLCLRTVFFLFDCKENVFLQVQKLHFSWQRTHLEHISRWRKKLKCVGTGGLIIS